MKLEKVTTTNIHSSLSDGLEKNFNLSLYYTVHPLNQTSPSHADHSILDSTLNSALMTLK